MKLIIDNEIYIPIYRIMPVYDVEYQKEIDNYKKSMIVSKSSFQSLFEALIFHILYWKNELDENISESDKESLRFEIEGLDFYKFFYDDLEMFHPISLINTYDGTYLYDDKIAEITFKLDNSETILHLDNGRKLILQYDDFMKIFKLKNKDEFYNTIESLKVTQKLYFDDDCLYFLNEKNYSKVILYLIEQIDFLNKIYARLKLPLISFQ